MYQIYLKYVGDVYQDLVDATDNIELISISQLDISQLMSVIQ